MPEPSSESPGGADAPEPGGGPHPPGDGERWGTGRWRVATDVPPRRRWSFRALVVTQFLGAFNDNGFKQLVLLLAVDRALGGEGFPWQAVATALFALPFVLFSGAAGVIADRLSKTTVVRAAKVAEILVMLLGLVGFATEFFPLLLFALFLMGTQSAFFGPAKYGILPEMLPGTYLSRANGHILMTTFLAIILGMAAAGRLKDAFPDRLWLASLSWIAVALVGTATAWGMAREPAARPGLSLRGRPLGDLLPTLRRCFADRDFATVLLTYSYLWFLGAVVQQAMNLYGKDFLGLDDTGTSLLLVSLSVGMAAGGLVGGYLSRDRIDLRLTRAGLLGAGGMLVALSFVHVATAAVHATLFVLGLSGSLFALPLQTWIQDRPPEGEKGRVVAAMNFVNWVFILLSSVYYGIAEVVLPPQHLLLPLALVTLLLHVTLNGALRRLQEELDARHAAGRMPGRAARPSGSPGP